MSDAADPIVILGGGFAGVNAAKHLQRCLPQGRDVILFSQENHLVFTPLLGNVVGSSINPMHVVWPVRQMVRRVNCRTAAVTEIDLDAGEVQYRTAGNHLAKQPFAHLVFACGNVTKLDIIPGMSAHGWPLKTMGDALVLRNHLIGLLEKAQVERDEERRKKLLSVVVVGGGFSGVEVAGEIADLLKESARFYKDVPLSAIRVTLLHRGERILPELPESLGEFARAKMQARGIDIRLKSEAQAVTEWSVRLKGGEEVPAATVVCTIGTTANPLLTTADLPMERGRIATDADLRVRGFPNVWALGDCAAVPNAYDNKPSPPTAQFAVRQAKTLARNLSSVLAGKPTKPFSFHPLGAFASIGNRRAVGRVFGLRFSGLPAWFLWRGIYLSKMPTLARKVQIAFDWFWQMFFPRDIVQLNLWQTDRMQHAHYEIGQWVFHKGDPGDKFYIIERGKAGVYFDDNGSPICSLGPDDHFGEGALLTGAARSASIRAEEPLDLLVVGQESFAQLTHHCAVLRTAMEAVWKKRSVTNQSVSSPTKQPTDGVAALRNNS